MRSRWYLAVLVVALLGAVAVSARAEHTNGSRAARADKAAGQASPAGSEAGPAGPAPRPSSLLQPAGAGSTGTSAVAGDSPTGPTGPTGPGESPGALADQARAMSLSPGIDDTEGDIDADVRSYYETLARSAAPLTAPQDPWTVRYALTTAGEPTVSLAEVGAVLATTYHDPRGWSLGGAVDFEPVDNPAEADFVVVVAEAAVIGEYSDACVSWQTGVADASCTVGNDVIINEDRWRDGALGDPYPLDRFRVHEINHETGHWLGQGHFSCQGGLAPVNQQQFRSLDGCTPNEWPLPWEQAMVAERHGLWGLIAPELASEPEPEPASEPALASEPEPAPEPDAQPAPEGSSDGRPATGAPIAAAVAGNPGTPAATDTPPPAGAGGPQEPRGQDAGP